MITIKILNPDFNGDHF